MSSKKFSEEQINSTRLILADFDGTLLHTDKKLSSLIRPAVDMLHKRGILFAVATARACNKMRQGLMREAGQEAT